MGTLWVPREQPAQFQRQGRTSGPVLETTLDEIQRSAQGSCAPVVGAEHRTRASEDNIERWWRIDLEASRPTGPVTVQVPITTGAADRMAPGAVQPFPRPVGLKLPFAVMDQAARERARIDARADRLIGCEVALALPPSDARFRPNAIVVDPPARARQARVPLIVLGSGFLVTVSSIVVAVILN